MLNQRLSDTRPTATQGAAATATTAVTWEWLEQALKDKVEFKPQPQASRCPTDPCSSRVSLGVRIRQNRMKRNLPDPDKDQVLEDLAQNARIAEATELLLNGILVEVELLRLTANY